MLDSKEKVNNLKNDMATVELTDKIKDERIAPVNRVFLATVLISLGASTVISLVFALIANIIAKDEVHYDKLVDKFLKIFNNDLFSIVFSQILLFIPVLIFILMHKERFVKNIRIRRLKASTTFLLVIFTVTITPVMSFINSISLLFSDNVIGGTITGITEKSPMLVGVLAVALLPAVCEEVAYRGLFYSEYSRISSKKAILLSGLMFGMLHMNINQFMYAAAMGMVFALVVEATDSIYSTMIIHFISNGISVLAMYALSGMESSDLAQTEQTISEMYGELAAQEGLNPTLKNIYESLADMPEQYAQVASLSGTAVIFGVVSLVIFIQIAKTSGRYNEIRKIFASKKKIKKKVAQNNNHNGVDNDRLNSDGVGDKNTEKKMFTPSLIIAFVICAFFMVYRQVKGI